MAIVFMTDPDTGRCALYDENGTSGALDDANSARNAPLNSPASHLDKVYFHSDFDYYQVHSITTVNVSHASVAAASTVVATQPSITRVGQVVKTHIDLVTHGLGYEPAYMIVSDGCLIGQSSQIQVASGKNRRVSPYATATKIRLLDVGISSDSALVSLARTYTVIVFRAPTADSTYLFDWDPETGALIMGLGKFRGALQALRRTLISDASPFDIPVGRTSDIRNGVSKTVLADGTVYANPVYDGSFTGSPSLQGTVE